MLAGEMAQNFYNISVYFGVNDVQRNPNLCADDLNRVYRTVLTTEKPIKWTLGENGLRAELFKYCPSSFITHLQQMYSLVWQKEIIPEDWSNSVSKKGDTGRSAKITKESVY
ncbi:unnamed protein product [Dracunculus medinensis]|uniref:RNA-dependent RNA polymerase n=1 Tax=Dracunculus medinensis TaxID=318479 RepID=A0A0N4U2Q5_DRAME|nr:unnamed protein product [Dracunculus medinensis]